MPKGTYTRVKLPVLQRILQKIVIAESGCWLWQGQLNKDKYGVIGVNGKMRLVHRVCFTEHGGVIPEDKPTIDHKCHNPRECVGGVSCIHRRCVNPLHLEPSSQSDNASASRGNYSMSGVRGRERNAAKTACPRGHLYTPDNTYINPTRSGGISRHCKECTRIRGQLRRNKASVLIET